MSPPVLTEAERAAAFARPPPRVPPKAVGWTIGICLVLALGGLLADDFFPGVSNTAAPVPTSAPSGPTLATLPPAGVDPTLSPSQVKLLELAGASGKAAPGFELSAAGGRRLALSSLRGKAVALWFFDAPCDDICPIAEGEIADAVRDLGTMARDVSFLAVNTDPFATSVSSAGPAEARLSHLGQVFQFLTGSLAALDAVWKAYGVTIEAQAENRTTSHNEALYFIGPSGLLEARASPFADQTGNEVLVLPSSTEAAFARGVAAELRYLVTEKSP